MLGRSVAVLVALTACAGATPSVPGFEHAPDKARLLAGELNCTKCHASDDIEPKGAPSLKGVGARLQADWLRAFLTDPAKAHPGTAMPDVLGKVEDRDAAVESLVHYLAAQREWKRPRLAKHAAAGTGEQLFKRIGCAACHDEPSLAHVKVKYSFPALVDFLRRPLDHRPGGRMPDLKLTAGEAADIAAYLTDTAGLAENTARAPLKPFTVVASEAVRGAELFRSVGCANCHSMEGVTPELESSPFGRPGECSVANYGLSPAQREALAKPIKPLEPKARIGHTLAALNCYACHARDGIGGPGRDRQRFFTGDETLGNEGRFPPHLNGVGAKLKADWMAKVLAGEAAVRPYLHTRMPVFGEGNVGHLPELFAKADRPEGDDVALAGGNREGGRFLLGTHGGVGCISCHGVGGRKGLAMHSVSLDGAAERYHADWFRKHLIDPQSTSPGTLMPSFWPGGEAGNKHVLGGDTERQIASIWTALRLGGDLPPGFPKHDTGEFEIEVGAWPVVQRTMMPGAGTHAVAVGFPHGVHFVYDALNCRVAGVWRGRFLDGYNPWFSRKNPTAEPLGEAVKMLPAVPPHPDRHFMGYRLGEGRVPEFLYRDEHGEVTVRIKPAGKDFLMSTTRGDKPPAKAVIIWR